MGLFSDSKEVYVSSSVYNLAGDEDDRPNYLKSTIFGSVMADSPSLGTDITNSYLYGPGIQQQRFFRWAKKNSFAGLPYVSMQNESAVDKSLIADEITIPSDPAGLEIVIQEAYISDGNFQVFAEQYILENNPSRITENWICDYSPSADEITIQFDNGDTVIFSPNGAYDSGNTYIRSRYYFTSPTIYGDWFPEATVSIDVLPDLTEWTQDSLVSSFTPVTLTRTENIEEVWSDSTPDNSYTQPAADVADELSTDVEVWSVTFVTEVEGWALTANEEQSTFTGTDYVTSDYVSDPVVVVEDLGGGVTKTTTTTITGEQVTKRWDHDYTSREVQEGQMYGGEQIYLYEIGSGNATLDALQSDSTLTGFEEFYPFIPVRIKNKSIMHPDYEANGLYGDCVTAYRKAMGWSERFSELVDKVEENDDIDDVDYAYMIFGVTLNVKEQECKKYLFKFFEEMVPFQNSTSDTISDFRDEIQAYEDAWEDHDEWEGIIGSLDQDVGSEWNSRPSEPPIPQSPSMPATQISQRTLDNRVNKFDIRIRWNHIEREYITGNFQFTDEDTPVARDSKIREAMVTKGTSISWQERDGLNWGSGDHSDQSTIRYVTNSIPKFHIYYQETDTSYIKLTIYGLTHENYIYEGKSVKITSEEALDDDDPSGFVVPLHYETMKETGIVSYTQMSTANTHILFNSYEVVTQKWYEKAFFKILLVIAVLVIAVIAFPGVFAGGAGLLGGNAAVGAGLGLTGTAGLVAGVVANYLAAMVISQMLSPVLVSVFGEKWGALVGALLSFAVGFAAGGFQLNIKTLLSFSSSLANGYAGFVQGETAEMFAEMQENQEDYEKDMEKIQDLIDGLGGNDLSFDPLSLTDTSYGNESSSNGSYVPETVDEFIHRTTMTGSDVVDVSLALVYDHASISTTLPTK